MFDVLEVEAVEQRPIRNSIEKRSIKTPCEYKYCHLAVLVLVRGFFVDLQCAVGNPKPPNILTSLFNRNCDMKNYGISHRKTCIVIAALCAFSLSTTPTHADNIIWSGAAADQDTFNVANYAASYDPGLGTFGPAPTLGPVNNEVYGGSIQYNDAGTLTGFPNGFSGLSVGDAEFACFDNTDVDARDPSAATGGLRNGTYEFLNGSDALMQYVAPLNDGAGTYYIDGKSSMNLTGGGNPINDGAGAIQLFLDAGASLTLTNLANFTTNQGNGDVIYFANSAGEVKSVNAHLADISGATITDLADAGFGTLSGSTFTATQAWTAPHVSGCPVTVPVPEPSCLSLLTVFAAMGLCFRKRR